MPLLHHAQDEQGSVLAITMLVMVMLTVIGVASMNTATIEQMIAGNERCYKENFFRAEAANNAGGQRYANLTDTSSGTGLTFGTSGPGVFEADLLALTGGEDWISSTVLPNNPLANLTIWGQALDANSLYTIVYLGIPTGASQGLTGASNTRKFNVYGQSDIKNGNAFIQTCGSVSF